ncbi:hypothetical protein, partial [Neisseria musculi]|uniref:hypothetical protein n=1 Tax=Neisseria musculi TaxID=1815583 RepID=UPI00361838E7
GRAAMRGMGGFREERYGDHYIIIDIVDLLHYPFRHCCARQGARFGSPKAAAELFYLCRLPGVENGVD